LDDTLGRAWAALAALPEQELTMVSTTFLERYLPNRDDRP
jgi:V/A-type H+-transporting ATPase subunit B